MTAAKTQHRPVLLHQALEYLAIRPEGTYVDATIGPGGHACEIAQRLTTGRLIGLDVDPEALRVAGEHLAPFRDKVTLVKANFKDLEAVLGRLGIKAVDGVLLDLGVSAEQLLRPERGLSFRLEGPLDMRLDPELPLTAADIVNQWPPNALERLLREYGEEPFAARIAKAIAARRREKPFRTTWELADLICQVIPGRVQRRMGIHPATRAFQALRIAVNHELESLKQGLEAAWRALKREGRLVVLSFHSLEDRIVKHFLKGKARRCVCPPEALVCQCRKVIEAEVFPMVRPSAQEIAENPRARSAKLRAARKLVSSREHERRA